MKLYVSLLRTKEKYEFELKESKDLQSPKIDELVGSLQTYEK